MITHLRSMCLYFFSLDYFTGVTGKYFQFLVESESSKDSRDQEVAKKLWDISAEMVNFETAKDV